ncbi:MAG: branched-chain amino acid transport system substrate-binding protein [Actinomycetota bacterium]|jgi:branched-chain amino acid transport system substrate-binding protein|nr:branched-chain amino acid transport system substrate-binding protein [Actinomycetota bacterium]
MHRRRFWRISVLVAVAALLLAACGSNKGEGSSTGTTTAKTNTVKIGVIAPLSGSLSALGQGIKNSVDLAIKQANDKNKVKGWKIELAAEDDTAKADVGAQVASKLESDTAVAGVVGTLNSSVALQVQPILARANVVMVSPANTGIELTQGTDPANKKRPYPNYFRVATTDAIQGPFAANYASKDLNAKNVVTIHDKKTYGQGLVAEFTKQLVKNGGKVVAAETINPGDQDFSAVLTKIKPLNADLIYYGGEYPEAQLLTSQAKAQGIKAPLMGGDGIFDKTYIQTAKEASEGDLCTSVGAPTDELASASDFVAAYKAAGYKDDFSAYGAYSYDAANVIIDALAKVLSGKAALTPALKQDIITAVQGTKLDGVTGKLGFDEFGDTTTKVLTVYKVTQQEWKAVKTDEFK